MLSININKELESSEENINDLLILANEQLNKKSKEIKELKNHLNNPNLEELKKLKKEELRRLLDYHKNIANKIEELI